MNLENKIIKELVLSNDNAKILSNTLKTFKNPKEKNKIYIDSNKLPEKINFITNNKKINIGKIETFYSSLNDRWSTNFTIFNDINTTQVTEGRSEYTINHTYYEGAGYIRCHLTNKKTPLKVLIRNRDIVQILIPMDQKEAGLINLICSVLGYMNGTDTVFIKDKNMFLMQLHQNKHYIYELSDESYTLKIIEHIEEIIQHANQDFYISLYRSSGDLKSDIRRIGLCLYT